MKERMAILILLFILYSALVSFCNVEMVLAVDDSWTTMAPMPTARSSFGVAVVNGKIFAIGGSIETWIGTNEMYDPVTDTWTTKASMPTPRGAFGIAVYQDKIYVIGGTTSLNVVGVNEVYDPATDTWETNTPMPTNRMNLCANVINGKIFLMAGNTLTGPMFPLLTNTTEVYDPLTDSWITKTSMPNYEGIAIPDVVSAVVNNKIYVFGCSQRDGNSLFNQIYDTETDTWSSGTVIPTEIYHAAAAATTGEFAPKRIHVMGENEHQVYDPETDTWSSATAMPTPRRYLGLAIVNDILYALGGEFGDPMGSPPISTELYSTNEQYTPSGYIPEFPSWIPTLLLVIVLVFVVAIYRRKLLKKRYTNGYLRKC